MAFGKLPEAVTELAYQMPHLYSVTGGFVSSVPLFDY
jgi:hypothetical protein